MKIVQIINAERTFKVTSNNKIIDVNLVENHTELLLEDGSVIIFENLRDYYSFIKFNNIFNPIKQEVNIPMLSDIAEDCVTDTVSGVAYAGMNISSVSQFDVKSEANGNFKFYYITRTKKV